METERKDEHWADGLGSFLAFTLPSTAPENPEPKGKSLDELGDLATRLEVPTPEAARTARTAHNLVDLLPDEEHLGR